MKNKQFKTKESIWPTRPEFEGAKNRTILLVNMVFTAIYLIWRTFFTVPWQYGTVSIIAGLSLLLVEIFGALEALVHYYNMHEVENYICPDVPKELYPEVCVFIATYTEPIDLLYKTVNGCKHISYPDKSKVKIYLCDDGHRPEVADLAARTGVFYLSRPDNSNAKAGNLNYALAHTSSELIMTMDADMIPRHDILMKTVPFFVDAKIRNENRAEEDKIKLGFVQTPQSFYNPDLFQFNLFSEGFIPNEQDYFYRDIQISRNKSNSVIYGGSNTIISREALASIGNFYTESITEDFATGIMLQEAGYKCFASNEVLASGLSPDDLPNLVQQRIRWARGVIQTVRKLNLFFTNKLNFSQKANYLASAWYWYAPIKQLVYYLSPILFGTFGYMVIICDLPSVLLFWLPMYLSSNAVLKIFSRNIRTKKWTNVYETVLFPYLFFPVVFESLGVSLKKFKVTSKDSKKKRGNDSFYSLYIVPFVLLIILSIIGIINCFAMMLSSGSISAVVVLFWLVSNLFALIMAFFFILGRPHTRLSERVTAEEKCRITDGITTVTTVTKDFSEGGVSVLLDAPVDYDDKQPVSVTITSASCQATLRCFIVHVDQIGKLWKYALKIENFGDSYDDYLQILYDRVPTMPQNLDARFSTYDNLEINIRKRVREPIFENRSQARIPLNFTTYTLDGQKILLADYNFKYLALTDKTPVLDFKLCLTPHNVLHCNFVRITPSGKYLYEITNYDELHNDGVCRREIETWLKEHLIVRDEEAEKQKEERAQRKKDKSRETVFDEMNMLS